MSALEKDTHAVALIPANRRDRKLEWQRNQRRQFQAEHGYSMTSHYATGKLREAVLIRDERKCVDCGMTEAEHLAKWSRPITIDHRDKNRKRNVMENLQTLCLTCHGRKDLIPALRVQRVPHHKDRIVLLRICGVTYQEIADRLGFSIAGIFNWCRRWEV